MTFEQIPNSLKNPLFFAEVGDPKGAGTQIRTTAMIGQRITGQGTGTNDIPVRIFSADDAAAIAGTGSILHRMAMQYYQTDKNPQKVIVVPIADEGGSAKAAKTLTFSFSSGATLTTSGTLHMLIAGRVLRCNVTAGMSLTDIGDVIEDALGADETEASAIGSPYAVTAANTAGAVAFTARNAGVLGNDIRIVFNYLGSASGQAFPGNLTIDDDDAYLTGGTGVADITAALLALSPYSIFALIEPLYSSDELLEKKVELADRWNWDVSTFGGHYVGVCKAAISDLLGSGKIEEDLQNDWHCVAYGQCRAAFCSEEAGASYAGALVASLRNDPSLPVQGVPLVGLYPIRENDRLTIDELEQLSAGGFATASTDMTGVPVISLERTTMLTNSLGAPVTGGEAVQYPYTTALLIEEMRTFVQTEYARVKLVSDGTIVAEGVAAVTPLEIKADLGRLSESWELRGLIESAAEFKAGLIVERDIDGNPTGNPNRVNVYASPDLANQLRVVAVRMVPTI